LANPAVTSGSDAKNEPQLAIVPLDLIQLEDVGAGAANVDAWLRDISVGVVSLERIKSAAGFCLWWATSWRWLMR
jgi:hypothetical protein